MFLIEIKIINNIKDVPLCVYVILYMIIGKSIIVWKYMYRIYGKLKYLALSLMESSCHFFHYSFSFPPTYFMLCYGLLFSLVALLVHLVIYLINARVNPKYLAITKYYSNEISSLLTPFSLKVFEEKIYLLIFLGSKYKGYWTKKK